MNAPLPSSQLSAVDNNPSVSTEETMGAQPPANLPLTLEDCYKPILPGLEALKNCLEQLARPDSVLLIQALDASLSTEGKLLRPALSLLIGQMLGIPQDRLVPVAAVSEMIHVATLLHDDVLDEADLRRGQPTVRQHLGNTISILAGDYLLAQASLKLAEIGNIAVVGLFSQVLADLCDGEVEQIRSSYRMDGSLETAWKHYFKKTICKTASLYAAACKAPALLIQASSDQQEALGVFGHHFGIAFQIVDDLLDYTSTTQHLGKPVLDDLRNGLLNAPVLLALEAAANQNNSTLKANIEGMFRRLKAGQAPQEEELLHIRQEMVALGAIEQTKQLAQHHCHQATHALGHWPEVSAEKQSLQALVHLLVSRSH
ncbi:MAG: polyprenyl synthetase family protein [Candidatus Melainabacteria bacterium]|nr:polyprenyl synthetase family protein [Candidatus Melainabacteria bacterium]